MASERPGNLIVNYIPPTLTDGELKELFERFGTVSACKIIRDKTTGLSYGYGFIDYEDPENAVLAVKHLDGLPLQNKKLKVSFSRQGADVKASNLYISNLPKNLDENDLEHLFGGFGQIIQTKVLTDPASGLSRGVGFIRFATREEAQYAINEMNGRKPNGFITPLLVKFAEDNKEKAKKIQQAILTGSLSPNAILSGGTAAIKSSLSPYGISNSGGVKLEMTGMLSQRHAIAPQFGMGYQSEVGGGPMRGGQPRQRFDPLAFPTSMPPISVNGAALQDNSGYPLFVYNLTQEADERALFNLFSPFGPLQKITVIRGSDKMSKGYGFVTMINMLDAQNAIKNLNGSMYNEKRLQVSLKTPKGTNKPILPVNMMPAVGAPVPAGVMPGMIQQSVLPPSNGGMMPASSMLSMSGSVASSEAGDSKGHVIFIYNIGTECDERALWTLFSPFGAVQKVNVVRSSDTHQSKGFGFVTMVNYHEAAHAIETLNGFPYNGRLLQVSFKQSKNPTDKQQHAAMPPVAAHVNMNQFSSPESFSSYGGILF